MKRPRLHESEILIYLGLVISGAGLWLWFGLEVALTVVGGVLAATGLLAAWRLTR